MFSGLIIQGTIKNINRKEHKVKPQSTQRMIGNTISNKIIGAAIKVHTELGPGLLESAYQECLFYVLQKEGLKVEKEKPMSLVFEEVKLDCGYRMDLLV